MAVAVMIVIATVLVAKVHAVPVVAATVAASVHYGKRRDAQLFLVLLGSLCLSIYACI